MKGGSQVLQKVINDSAYIESILTQFKLVDIKCHYKELINQAIKEKMSYQDFLIELLRCEELGKHQRKVERLIKNARFETTKGFSDIDFSFNPNLDFQQIKHLVSLEFLERHENIILIGPPGVGKTLIASAIGREACEMGKGVLFVNAVDLMNQLVDARKNGTLKNMLKKLGNIDLLIIDELGYLKMDIEKESIFFQLIRQRYEKRSLIVTSNLPLGRWNEVFTGQIAATAILDRLLHHAHVLSITGDSYRVNNKVKG